ncbi:hypothetical protein L3V82_10980 [Thiotrichales bacterium 19S3-7]|nr:hypothetical protein [Thiotrichales bacterium 19S3-7]MCF6802703.1 hypothetical protein [Thiotrichales bacterium 19S3-11]
MIPSIKEFKELEAEFIADWRELTLILDLFKKNYHTNLGTRVVSEHNTRETHDGGLFIYLDQWINITNSILHHQKSQDNILREYVEYLKTCKKVYDNFGLNNDITMLSILSNWQLYKSTMMNKIHVSIEVIEELQKASEGLSKQNTSSIKGVGGVVNAGLSLDKVYLLNKALELKQKDIHIVSNHELNTAIQELINFLVEVQLKYYLVRKNLINLKVDFNLAFDKWFQLYGRYKELTDKHMNIKLRELIEKITFKIDAMLDLLERVVYEGIILNLHKEIDRWVQKEAPLLQLIRGLPYDSSSRYFSVNKILNLVNFKSINQAYLVQKLFSNCFWGLASKVHHIKKYHSDKYADNVLKQWKNEDDKINILRFAYDAALTLQKVLQHKNHKYVQYLQTQEGRDMIFAKWMQLLAKLYLEQTTVLAGDSFKQSYEIEGIVLLNNIPVSIRRNNKWHANSLYDANTREKLLQYLECMCEQAYVILNNQPSRGLSKKIIDAVNAHMHRHNYTNPFKAFRDLFYHIRMTNKSDKYNTYTLLQEYRSDLPMIASQDSMLLFVASSSSNSSSSVSEEFIV